MDKKISLEDRAYYAKRVAEEFLLEEDVAKVVNSAVTYIDVLQEYLPNKTLEFYTKTYFARLEMLFKHIRKISVCTIRKPEYFFGWDEKQQDFIDTRTNENKGELWAEIKEQTEDEIRAELEWRYGKKK